MTGAPSCSHCSVHGWEHGKAPEGCWLWCFMPFLWGWMTTGIWMQNGERGGCWRTIKIPDHGPATETRPDMIHLQTSWPRSVVASSYTRMHSLLPPHLHLNSHLPLSMLTAPRPRTIHNMTINLFFVQATGIRKGGQIWAKKAGALGSQFRNPHPKRREPERPEVFTRRDQVWILLMMYIRFRYVSGRAGASAAISSAYELWPEHHRSLPARTAHVSRTHYVHVRIGLESPIPSLTMGFSNPSSAHAGLIFLSYVSKHAHIIITEVHSTRFNVSFSSPNLLHWDHLSIEF